MNNWLSRVDVCMRLGVSESRLDEMLEAGEFPPARRIRGHFHYWPNSVVRAALARLRPVAENRRAMLPAGCEVR